MSEHGPGADPGTGAEEVGSVAEEATKLLGAVAEWARDQGSELGAGLAGLADQAAASAQEINAHLATDDPECRFCPICRTVHVVRQANPEVRAQLVAGASSFLQAAAGFLAGAASGSAPESASVQHIDIDLDGTAEDRDADDAVPDPPGVQEPS